MPTKRAEYGTSLFERIEALLRDENIYRDRGQHHDPALGGRPRKYPDFLEDVFETLCEVLPSARAAATALHSADRVLWDWISKIVIEEQPHRPDLHLPVDPPCRTWYIKRVVRTPEPEDEEAAASFRQRNIEIATEVGHCDPAGGGSYTHPVRSRLMYGDGKVIKSPFNGSSADTREVRSFDPATGEEIVELVPVRFDPDAKEFVQGDGRKVVGNKFAFIATRGPEVHDRVILDVQHVPDVKGEHNSEADILVEMIDRASQALPGALGVLTDKVLRGKHIEQLSRERGLLVINGLNAKTVDPETKDRTEKECRLKDEIFHYHDGTSENVEIWTKAGGLCRVLYDDRGKRYLDPLERVETLRRPNQDGTWRFYVRYRVPDPRGAGPPQFRLEATTGDKINGRSRAENIRQLPPADADYPKVAGQRSDAESINRQRDDELYLRRARSVGAKRQLRDYRAYARTVNALTLFRHRKRQAALLAEAA